MSASKMRLLWGEMPRPMQAAIERLVDGRVVVARNCPGGFSPGFASRLTLADGRQVFVKAMDAVAWPDQAEPYRTEGRVAAVLPGSVAAPRLFGFADSERWVILVFEDVDGCEPAHPWRRAELDRVLAVVGHHSQGSSPTALPEVHPRLGGWTALARDPVRVARLPAYSPWAASHEQYLKPVDGLGKGVPSRVSE